MKHLYMLARGFSWTRLTESRFLALVIDVKQHSVLALPSAKFVASRSAGIKHALRKTAGHRRHDGR